MNNCKDENCKRKVHFVSPEFCQFFKYAVVETDEGEKIINLPIPTWFLDEPDDGKFHGFDNYPLTAGRNDCKIVTCPGKSGIQKDDPYYLEMERIEKEYEK